MDDDDSSWLPLALGQRTFRAAGEVAILLEDIRRHELGTLFEEAASDLFEWPTADMCAVLVRELQAFAESGAPSVTLRRAAADVMRHAQVVHACLGDPSAPADVAQNLLRAALSRGDDTDDDYSQAFLLRAALGWLGAWLSTPQEAAELVGRNLPHTALRWGDHLADLLITGSEKKGLRDLQRKERMRRAAEEARRQAEEDSVERVLDELDGSYSAAEMRKIREEEEERGLRDLDAAMKARQQKGMSVEAQEKAITQVIENDAFLDQDELVSELEAMAEEPEPELITVIPRVAASTGSWNDVGSDLDLINGKSLYLVEVPDLAEVREQLVSEFPHFESQVDTILSDLVGRKSVRLRPTLLLGEPGSGKSRLARRLFESLYVPHCVYPAGGSSDNSLAGTPRRWNSSEPSLPVRLVRDHERANVGVVVDELEKAAAGRGGNGGRLWDALVQLVEPETAARYEDPYVQAPCNLSAVNWIATANGLEHVPAPLLDRLRIIRMPEPGHEHLPALAASMMDAAVVERGLDLEWAQPFDEIELQALRQHWKGGSLRALRRLVEGVLAARDAAATRH